ncbi:serine acetyltransferase [Intestinirhabdus alba]|jgi:serine O-acetyltransferase|uniref:Serine acetyltransferase n=1 Tax=Intestinirhabdus alba TaxID=2899544 RepID=A0A6L6IML9_9ENTR|nr:DapH/DapD/GlmU-related protein [Intestinirhabdus alba]MTH47194.1 serine acetyltransferase [Intestinirhabdus alba]
MDKAFLQECLRVEVIGGRDKAFTWPRAIRHAWRQPKRRFLFWWRIASYLYSSGGKRTRKIASFINRRLMRKYHTEIGLGAKIQPGLNIAHYNGIVVSIYCEIGKNFLIRQNTTIGIKQPGKNDAEYQITIGDNVTLGANCCIIADRIKIGSNVTIGAMSFINKDIPDNTLYYTRKENTIESQSQ